MVKLVTFYSHFKGLLLHFYHLMSQQMSNAQLRVVTRCQFQLLKSTRHVSPWDGVVVSTLTPVNHLSIFDTVRLPALK